MIKECHIVGILNTTPDSFSDGGRYRTPQDAIAEAALMFEQGASWVDVGGESTRPGATPIEIDEEWRRVEPILNELIPGYTGCISLDTRHPEIVRRAAQAGTVIINDVTNFSNPLMRQVAAEFGFLCIASHIPYSSGGDIQKAHQERLVDSVQQVLDEQMLRVEEMKKDGIREDQIILDPGIGFGKPAWLNLELVEYARYVSGFEVFLGISRKSSLKVDARTGESLVDSSKLNKQELNAWLDVRSAELALDAVAIGAKYLRVHNVQMHVKALAAAGLI
jgi:dihydropteroate synthase